jgi:uncharacterized membrane protein
MKATPSAAPSRIEALDALRGLIMLLMALDHAADFVSGHHTTEIWGNPIPVHESGLAFATRAISHLCAPGFFLLMGVAMALFAASRLERGWSQAQVTGYFARRAGVLVLIDLFVASPPFVFSMMSRSPVTDLAVPPVPGGGEAVFFSFGVLTALGFSMLVGGLLLRAGAAACAAGGVAVAIGCQLIVPGFVAVDEAYSVWLRVTLIPGQSGPFMTIYSVVPWFSACALGLAGGELLRRDPERALRAAPAVGLAMLVGFIVLRVLGGFGNTHPAESVHWLALLNVTKYPPSLVFWLLTLGIDLLLLGLFAALARGPHGLGSWARPLLVLGRAPLFFYVVHLWFFCAVGLLMPGDVSLAALYPIWLVGVGALLPACAWYGRFKSARPAESLWRLF